jgi:hypothetical protein
VHLIHHAAPRHAAAMPGLLPDGGPAALPRERASWRSVLHLLLFLAGIDAGDQPEDATPSRAPRSAVQTPGVFLAPVRPAHTWPHLHVPHPHLGAVHLPVIPALAGRILHRTPRAAAAKGLAPAAFAVVPTVPTAAGPTGNALGVPLYGPPLVPTGRYLPGEDPRTSTQQLHALHEGALAALDLHFEAVRDACGRLDALALAPLPSDAPAPGAAVEPPQAQEPDASTSYEPPPFAMGAHRRPVDVGLRVAQFAVAAAPKAGRHVAGSAAAQYVIGGAR